MIEALLEQIKYYPEIKPYIEWEISQGHNQDEILQLILDLKGICGLDPIKEYCDIIQEEMNGNNSR